MELKNKIETILAAINSEIEEQIDATYSLHSGKAGWTLFQFCYVNYINSSQIQELLHEEIQVVAENSLSVINPTFCTGRSGINWFFRYLVQKKALDIEDCEFLCDNDEELAAIALNQIAVGNYDFLHGATGIAYYLLSKDYIEEQFFAKFFDALEMLTTKSIFKESIPKFDFNTQQIIPNQINLGLSHGIPSILKYCLECIKKQICIPQATLMARNIMTYIIKHANNDFSKCYYPNQISANSDQTETYSRLAWCYGDLSIGYILLQSGILFTDKNTIDVANRILKHTITRKTVETTKIADAGVCHGSAGVAHIYNKLWQLTGDVIYREACDYWITATLQFQQYNDTKSGYKMYVQQDGVYRPECGLLEGSAGIGLVLLSYLTNDSDWDYCLMLN